jgi:menaquinone-9 beta-reductase
MSAAVPIIEEAELVVVGAGPAGSACAARAAERGLDVLLIDQDDFPRDKPCGDGVTRSGVAYLLELGLDDLVERSQPIEGARIFFPHGPEHRRRYETRRDHPQHARTIPRTTMDHALRDAAVARGARFLRARVDGPASDGAVGVEVEQAGAAARVSARIVVAADGATSRMRRQCGIRRSPDRILFYAVRQYARTERALDPVFHMYFPVVFEGRGVAGYGWVFPIGTHLANVGIGYMRGLGGPTPPLRLVLAQFVRKLAEAPRHYGALELRGKPFGSPVAVDFERERCSRGNVLFVGDAAGTVDPFSGEGIALAFRAGTLVADEACARLRMRRPRADVGDILGRAFPRLGQDVAPLARLLERTTTAITDRPALAPQSAEAEEQPVAREAIRMLEGSPRDTTLRGTPLVEALEQAAPSLAATLEEWNGAMLDCLRTEFPFATEILHNAFRDGSGPILTASLLAARDAAGGGPPDAIARDTALSIELLRLGHLTLARIPSELASHVAHVAAGMAVLMADFCFARSMTLSVPIGGGVPDALSSTNRVVCGGRMLDSREVFNTNRTPQNYLTAITGKTAALFELSTRLGAHLAHADPTTTQHLATYGLHLGIAYQIADDIHDLHDPDANDLRYGNYTLPVIHAIQHNPQLATQLTNPHHTPTIPHTNQTHQTLTHHINQAHTALTTLPNTTTLTTLAELPLARVPAPATGEPAARVAVP